MNGRKSTLAGIVVSLGLVLITGCSAQSKTTVHITADYPHYESLHTLWADADVVVEVAVQNAPRVERINVAFPMPGHTLREEEREGDVYTVFDVVATKVWKGQYYDSQEFSVKQPGGEREGERHVAEDVVYLAVDEKYLLFLATFDEVNIPASLLNPVQGQYRLDVDGAPQSLTHNQLAINIADLEDLAEM